MATLTIIVGLSRSGKTSLALERKAKDPDLLLLSRDDYRRGYINASEEQRVTEAVLKDFYNSAYSGKNVIIADTNLSAINRNAWVERAYTFQMKLEFLVLHSGLQKLETLSAMELLEYPQYILDGQVNRFKSFLAEDLIPDATYTFV